MSSRIAKIAAACLAAFACAANAQDKSESFWSSLLSAINDTTPAGVRPRSERASGWAWFGDQWDGGKAIAANGQMQLLLPFYTFHPAWQYANHAQQNAYPFGAGIASYTVDSRDNERIVYALAFSDSHFNFEPMAGYGWVARWRMFGQFKVGVGYTAMVTTRNDAMWLPVPGLLPLLFLGTDAVGVYAANVPTQNVTFMFVRLSPEKLNFGAAPEAPAAGDARRNLLFAGYGYVNANPSGIDGVAGTNGSGPVLGYRRFFGDRFAAEVSVERSRHDLSFPQQALGSLERTAYTLAAQYHFPIAQRVQLYAGIGAAYERLSQQQLVDASLRSNSLGPVIQGGFSASLDPRWTLTGGIRTGFPRNQLTLDGVPSGTVLLAPATFSLALGARF